MSANKDAPHKTLRQHPPAIPHHVFTKQLWFDVGKLVRLAQRDRETTRLLTGAGKLPGS